MPKYRVLAKSFINNTVVEEGAVVEYDGQPGSNLELLEPAKAEGDKGKKGKRGAWASGEPGQADADEALVPTSG